MNDLQARKQQLLVRSEIYRCSLAAECAHIQAATAWIPRTLQYARMASPILAVAAPLAAWLFGSRSKRVIATPPRKRNLLGTMLVGYKVARQIKPVWDGFRRSRASH